MKNLKGFLQHIVSRPIWIIGGFLILSLVLISPVAFAQTSNPSSWGALNFLDFIGGNSLIKLLFGVIFGVVGAIAALLSNLFVLIINTIILPGQNSLFFGTGNQATVIKQAFDSMLGIANILFFITLVVFAIMIITRQSGYNFKKAITALITAIVLANISYPLVQVLIELGDSLRNTGTALFGGDMNAGALKDWMSSLAVLNFTFDTSVSTMKYIFLSFAGAATQVILAYVFFRLMVVLVERAIRLVALTIFAPIQAVLGIFPQKDLQIGGNWISEVIKWIMVLPVVFIVIGIAKQIMPNNTTEELKNIMQNVWPDQAGTNTTTPTISGLAFQIILGLGLMASAANAPALLKLTVSSATKFLGDSLGGGGFIGKPLRAQTGLAKDFAQQKFNATKVGQFFNRGTIANQSRKDKIEQMKKANEVRTESAVSDRNMKVARRDLTALNANQDKWINSQQPSWTQNASGDWLDAQGQKVDDPEVDAIKKLYAQKNPSAAVAMATANRLITNAQVKEREDIQKIDPPQETVEAELTKLFAKREYEIAHGGQISDETAKAIRQQIEFAMTKTNQGAASVPWKMMLNQIQAGEFKNADGQAIAGTKDAIWGKNYETDAGLNWKPPKKYLISEQDRRKWESAKKDSNPATDTSALDNNTNAPTILPQRDLLTQQTQAETELHQAEATRNELSQTALTDKLMATVTPTQMSGALDSTDRLDIAPATTEQAVHELVGSIDGLLESLGAKEIATAKEALISSLSPAQQANLTNTNVQQEISDVLNDSGRSDADKTNLINEILAGRPDGQGAIDPDHASTLGNKLAEGLVKHEFNLSDVAKIKDITDKANQIGGETAVGIVNSRLSQPTSTTIERTITEKTNEVNTIKEQIVNQAVADPAIRQIGETIIAQLDPTALDDLISKLDETADTIKSTLNDQTTGDTKFSQLSPDAMQVLMTKLDQASAKVGLPATSLIGVDQSRTLTQINNNIVGMREIARAQKQASGL